MKNIFPQTHYRTKEYQKKMYGRGYRQFATNTDFRSHIFRSFEMAHLYTCFLQCTNLNGFLKTAILSTEVLAWLKMQLPIFLATASPYLLYSCALLIKCKGTAPVLEL